MVISRRTSPLFHVWDACSEFGKPGARGVALAVGTLRACLDVAEERGGHVYTIKGKGDGLRWDLYYSRPRKQRGAA